MSVEDPIRVQVLLEALPYIRSFAGKTIVIKFGGAAMKNPTLASDFARDVVLLQLVGMQPVIVHGGGPRINQLLNSLGIASEFVDGHRVTDDAAMEVVEMVLSGQVNKEIVSVINHEGGRAVGISGKDGGLAVGELHTIQRLTPEGKMETVSLGRVGKLGRDAIRMDLLERLMESGYIPVIAPVAVDKSGHSLNVNADTMAGAIASALKAEKLVLLTDTPGILADGATITGLTPPDVKELVKEKVIGGGMIPKVECCLSALEAGVRRTHIIDGSVAHSLLLEVFTDGGIGTLIARKEDLPEI